ncbi:MAG: N-formylglutamate amidohydrolase [Gammaproteobacteria bacterium]|nr:N-formylglutamate amidohydrolase [Gammaproteobacteria bacterium]
MPIVVCIVVWLVMPERSTKAVTGGRCGTRKDGASFAEPVSVKPRRQQALYWRRTGRAASLMQKNDHNGTNASPDLLAADEPAPFTLLNAASHRPILLVCDHASARFPRFLGDFGLDAETRRSHRAVDLGAAELARKLASTLGAAAVFAGYSRLVVDCNRNFHDAQAFKEYSDGVDIPGNRGLSEAQKLLRAEKIYRPYHEAVAARIARLTAAGKAPLVLAIHSFTPVYEGMTRPWEAGILWDEDDRIAAPMMDGLRRAGLVVGDNQPYSGKTRRLNYTLDQHAAAVGLPHACIEVRQDLIEHEQGVDRIATIIAGSVDALPPSVYSVSQGAVMARSRAHAIDEDTKKQKRAVKQE